MIVVKIQTNNRQIISRNTLSKSSKVSLLSKNENRAKIAFKNKQNVHISNIFLSIKQITTTQK